MISVSGAPAAAAALEHLEAAVRRAEQPGRLARFLGAAPLEDEAMYAYDHVGAVLRVAQLLKPLATQGWLVLPAVRFEGSPSDELDFFVLSPLGEAYALLTQGYPEQRVRADRKDLHAGGYVDALPATVRARTRRVTDLLQSAKVPHAQVTPVLVITAAQSLRAPRKSLPLIVSEATLVRQLRRREAERALAGGKPLARDERLLTPQFWRETPGFDANAYRAHLSMYGRLRRQVNLLPLVRLGWRVAVLVGMLAIFLGTLIWFGYAHPDELVMPERMFFN